MSPVKPGTKSGKVSAQIKLGRSGDLILTVALNCCKVILFFPGRFLEAVLTLCMIFLTGSGMLICLYFVRNITCSQIWRIGKIVSCSWNPVRKKCLRRSIGRHWSISRERACLMLCLVSWWVNLWMKPMHRSTNST